MLLPWPGRAVSRSDPGPLLGELAWQRVPGPGFMRAEGDLGPTGGPSSLRLNFYYLENWIRDFPGSQWLRIHLEMRGTPVLYLV